MNKIFLIFLFIFFSTVKCLFGSSNVVLSDYKFDFQINLKDKFLIYVDSSIHLGIGHVYKKDFTISKTENSFGKFFYPLWIKIRVENYLYNQKDLFLEINNCQIDSIEVYIKNRDYPFPHFIAKTGDQLEFTSRPIPSRNFTFYFTALANDTTDIYLRIRQINSNITLPLNLYTINSYYKKESSFLLFLYLSLGIMICMALLSLFICVVTRKILFCYYACYVLCIILYEISRYGLGMQLFWPDEILWNYKSTIFFGCLYFVFFNFFITNFLNFNLLHRFFKYINIFFSILISVILIYFLLANSSIKSVELFYNILYFTYLAGLIYSGFVITIIAIKDKKIVSWILWSVYLIILFTVGMIVVNEIIILPVNEFTENGVLYIADLEVLMLGILLSYQVYLINLEKQKLMIEKSKLKDSLLDTEYTIQEKEREKIAHNLHDDLAIHLVLSKLALSNQNPDYNYIKQNLEIGLTKIRNISRNIHPSILKTFGLQRAIEEQVENILKLNNHTINVHFDFSPLKNADNDIHIYRIVTELLNNTIKHAKATKIDIRFSFKIENDLPYFSCHYKDNGIGMDITKIDEGFGLKNIIGRIEFLKGNYEITSKQEEGFYFKFTVLLK